MATRLPPKTMAKKLVRVLRAQHPDYPYLKKVFQHTRELLDVSPAPQTTRLPELLTEAELVAFYDAVWHARQLTYGAMLKLLLYLLSVPLTIPLMCKHHGGVYFSL